MSATSACHRFSAQDASKSLRAVILASDANGEEFEFFYYGMADCDAAEAAFRREEAEFKAQVHDQPDMTIISVHFI